MSKTEKSNKIIKDLIIKHPGDLVHMDQDESSTPGRPLTYSGKNNKRIFLSFPSLSIVFQRKYSVNFNIPQVLLKLLDLRSI